MKNKNEKYIELGGCSKPHGIKGAFSFHLYNRENSVLVKGAKVLLTPGSGSRLPKEGREYEILKISFGNKVIVFLKEIDNRNQVEEILPFSIYYKQADLPEVNDDEYYIRDLIGLEVIDELTNKKIGKISEYYDNSAQIVLVIQGDENFEVPLIDNFVKEIDIKTNTIRILVPQMIGSGE